MKQKNILAIVSTIVFFATVAFIGWFALKAMEEPTVYRFEISEISDGIYAYREVAVSAVPAQNYTMATVCDKGGNMFTIRGTVNIISQTNTAPYAVWEKRNIVNGDTITIYAPANTIQYLGTVSIGKR